MVVRKKERKVGGVGIYTLFGPIGIFRGPKQIKQPSNDSNPCGHPFTKADVLRLCMDEG